MSYAHVIEYCLQKLKIDDVFAGMHPSLYQINYNCHQSLIECLFVIFLTNLKDNFFFLSESLGIEKIADVHTHILTYFITQSLLYTGGKKIILIYSTDLDNLLIRKCNQITFY